MLLFIIIIILSYLFVFKTDFFVLSEITVEGNKKLNFVDIINASSCNIGENIFNIDIEKGEENLKLLPYIKDCKIKRQLPDKLIIEIEERKEVAVVEYLEHVFYIDNEGYILKIDNNKDVELPVIKGLDMVHYVEGDNIYQENYLNGLKEFIFYSEDLGILNIVNEIDLSNEEDINIELNDSTLVAFGPLNNVKYKLSFLIEILQDLEKKNIVARKIIFNKGENPIIVMDNR